MNKQRIIMLCLTVIMLISFCLSVNAASIQTFSTDSSTGWNTLGWKHLGSRNTTYTYGPLFIEYGYSDVLSNALALWGSSYITMTLNVTSSNKILVDNASGLSAYAYVESSYDSNYHINRWTMTLVHHSIASLSSTGKSKVIAHEIGHIAGLDHVENASSIMNRYYSSSMGVRTQDRRGMEVCTHQHTHSGSYSKTYEPYSANGHKTRCTYCKAYSLDVHVFVNKRCKFCGLGQGISPYSFEQYKLNYLRNAASDR